jgi:serine/threonine-protein kinase
MCPAPEQLVAFLSGGLPEAQASDLELHMDSCTECRAVLSNMARGGPPPSLGRYRIDTVLGSGGMGIVYRGFDPQLARPVAIKVVRRAGEDTQGRARLVREAQALARLSHPNVCHVYDVGTEDDEVWLAMELIDGVQLRTWASDGHSRNEVITALLGAAEGIAAAHNAGLVHRDIKPENVLVTRDDRPIVTDFGLARNEDVVNPNAPTAYSDPNLTATGAIAGTPAYLAPEQLLGDPIDARVDQFAWAVMAWELLTGARPFPVVFAVRVEAVRAGLAQPAGMPKPLYAALSRAMSASPADRFPSMRELIDAVKATPAATDAPVSDRARNNIFMVGGAAGVLAIAAAAFVLWPRHHEPAPATTPAPIVAVVPADAAASPRAVDAQDQLAVAAPIDAALAAPPAPAVAVERPRPKHGSRDLTAPLPAPVPAPAPPPQQQQIQKSQAGAPNVTPPVGQLPAGVHPYCRSCQIASADAFCRIPTDFANTGFDRDYEVLDYGTVTKVEDELGKLGDREIRETIITIRGQRKTYRIHADFLGTYVSTHVGALLAICPEDDSDIYSLSGGPTTKTHVAITLSAPPRLKTAAKLGARHLHDLQLAATSQRGAFDSRVTADGVYLINAEVQGIDGPRYKMDRYWLEVPDGMKGEDKLETKKSTWMVVGKLRFEEIEGEQQLVVKALAILDDIFP